MTPSIASIVTGRTASGGSFETHGTGTASVSNSTQNQAPESKQLIINDQASTNDKEEEKRYPEDSLLGPWEESVKDPPAKAPGQIGTQVPVIPFKTAVLAKPSSGGGLHGSTIQKTWGGAGKGLGA
ncbi:hypothetical protein QFC24_006969 [Naganishia onofrii]|uniref:Uncharacterized protein n=1 Tax=Naganishia onofrii TaxID=1851511 RepID=A0ACC2WW23_9TREE|nr:hypothetical protein QFC24_006969 [Naganishia onofrii]